MIPATLPGQRYTFSYENKLIATAILLPTPPSSYLAAAVELWSFEVYPDHRGFGWSKIVLNDIISWARGKEYQRIILWVLKTNIAAIHLYETHGFRYTGESTLDSNFMVLDLNTEPTGFFKDPNAV